MSILHKTPANSTYLIYRTLMDRGVDIGLALATVDCLVPDDDTPPWPLDDNADFEPLGPADDDGPESWPEWTDEDCWVHGPEPFEPADDDREWVAGLPSDEELEQMARHAAWLDHLEGLARMTDEDVLRVTGSCG